ncbi:hypothetical protein F3W84_02190 [Ochrobactrum quorumnocens]|uniref:Uncharacterized protein n=1 Tax=Ochrobactrum quorumnocens TaxID=271865 RepID=A0A5N1K4N5_9HYPH|nr:hypothetical protein F3W84_02190 [[Ochrobactrum] quorumnocens]
MLVTEGYKCRKQTTSPLFIEKLRHCPCSHARWAIETRSNYSIGPKIGMDFWKARCVDSLV